MSTEVVDPPLQVNPDDVARSWTERGFSCDLWSDPPGQKWENFRHDRDELIMVLEGNMEFEVEGRIFHPEPGEELPIPATARHSARNVGKRTAHWLYGCRLS